MVSDLPESESQTPDGVPLGWVAPWEKPQMMVVEEREGMAPIHVYYHQTSNSLYVTFFVVDCSNVGKRMISFLRFQILESAV